MYGDEPVDSVPASVRALLLDIDNLQSCLRLWGIRQATESTVSDAYVRTGTQFNKTVSAFAACGVDLSAIHGIPKDLRAVLEQCLAEDPSQQTLEVFMPQVESVLRRLLRGLRDKREEWNRVSQNMR